MPFNRPKFRAHVKAHKTVIGQRAMVPQRSAVPRQAVHREKDGETARHRDQDPVPGSEAGGQGCQRRTRRCLPPAPGQIDPLPSTPALRLIRLPQMRKSVPAGQGRCRTNRHRRSRQHPRKQAPGLCDHHPEGHDLPPRSNSPRSTFPRRTAG